MVLVRYGPENKSTRHVLFVELPKTSTGKIQKFKLREMAKAECAPKPQDGLGSVK